MARASLVLSVALCALFRAGEAAGPILEADGLGLLKGVSLTTEEGKQYFGFLGIPYAEPPVGQLRFKEPVPKGYVPDTTVVNATSRGAVCLQLQRNPKLSVGEEDCLRVNVYTPSYVCQAPTYPVLVYIHGGAFMYGTASASARRLVARDIVVVTINYRLGVLGFLSSGDKDLPGNLGLLDQQAALRWVQKNIHYFCGNPGNVTLSGASAGGASTTLHMLSPGSAGLFQKAIPISGTVLNPWVQHFGDRERVRAVARLAGCPTWVNQPISELLPCLRSVNGSNLIEAEAQFQGWQDLPFAPFGPVIDGKFISADPYKLLTKGQFTQVPVLLSVTTEEGLYTVAEFMKNDSALAELDRRWNDLAPLFLDYEATARTNEDRANTSSRARSKYLGNARISNQTLAELIQMEGDRHFVAGVDHFAKTLASARGSKPVYFYQFGYRAKYSLSEGWANSSENHGVGHMDDLMLILPGYSYQPLVTEADWNMSRSLVDIWQSFITTGVPVTTNFPVWKPVPTTGDKLVLLNITSYRNATLETVTELGHSTFWRSLPLYESGFANSFGKGGAAGTIASPVSAVLLIVASVILRLVAAE